MSDSLKFGSLPICRQVFINAYVIRLTRNGLASRLEREVAFVLGRRNGDFTKWMADLGSNTRFSSPSNKPVLDERFVLKSTLEPRVTYPEMRLERCRCESQGGLCGSSPSRDAGPGSGLVRPACRSCISMFVIRERVVNLDRPGLQIVIFLSNYPG